MSAPIDVVFILTGGLEGKTIKLGNRTRPYSFVNGRLTLTGPSEEIALHARFLERNWEAYPEGHPKIKQMEKANGQRDIQTEEGQDGQLSVSGDISPQGSGVEAGGEADQRGGAVEDEEGNTGVLPEGDRQPESVMPGLNKRLLRAVKTLRADDDTLWTRDGKPAMSALERAYGASDITRADVEAVAPGYTRAQAMRAQIDNS